MKRYENIFTHIITTKKAFLFFLRHTPIFPGACYSEFTEKWEGTCRKIGMWGKCSTTVALRSKLSQIMRAYIDKMEIAGKLQMS